MRGRERAGGGVFPDRDDPVVVASRRDVPRFLLLRGIAVRGRKCGGENAPLLVQPRVVKLRVDLRPREDDEAAAAAQVFLQRRQRGLGDIDDVCEHHRLVIAQPRGLEFRHGHGLRPDEILRAQLGRDGRERVAQIEDLALARLDAGIAVGEQHIHLADRADGGGARVVGGRAILRDARGHGVEAGGAEGDVEGDFLRLASGDGVDARLVRGRLGVDAQTHLHVRRILRTGVADLDLEAHRLPHRRKRAGHSQAGHREIVRLAFADEDDAGLRLLLRGVEHRARLRELLPAGGLTVGD